MNEELRKLYKKGIVIKNKSNHIDMNSLKELSVVLVSFRMFFDELDCFLADFTFKSVKSEVKFMKSKLPSLLYSYWYLFKWYRILAGKPLYSEILTVYYQNQIEELIHFKVEHQELHLKYTSESNYLDETHFVRPVSDKTFSSLDTTHASYCYAYFEVVDNLVSFIHRLLFECNKTNIPTKRLHWTGKNTDLALMIYFLIQLKCINNGEIALQEAAKYFENIFDIFLQGKIPGFVQDAKKRKNLKDSIFSQLQEKFLEVCSKE